MPTVLADFPLDYEVFGVRKGHRSPRSYLVREAVPLAFEAIDEVDARIAVAYAEGRVARGRFWLPVNDGRGDPIPDVAALDAFADFGTDEYRPIEVLRPDEGRRKGVKDMETIALAPGDDLSSAMRSTEWSGRDAAYARMRRYADRIAFVEGRPMTDRLEPVVPFGRSWGETNVPYLADVVTGAVMFTHGGLSSLQDCFADEPFVSPSDGPLTGLVEWRFDATTAAAAFLAHRIDDVLKARTGFRSVAHDNPLSFSVAVATLSTAASGVAVGLDRTLGREELEDCMRTIAAVRSDNPRHAATVAEIGTALTKVREALALQESLTNAPSRLDEDAFALMTASG